MTIRFLRSLCSCAVYTTTLDDTRKQQTGIISLFALQRSIFHGESGCTLVEQERSKHFTLKIGRRLRMACVVVGGGSEDESPELGVIMANHGDVRFGRGEQEIHEDSVLEISAACSFRTHSPFLLFLSLPHSSVHVLKQRLDSLRILRTLRLQRAKNLMSGCVIISLQAVP